MRTVFSALILSLSLAAPAAAQTPPPVYGPAQPPVYAPAPAPVPIYYAPGPRGYAYGPYAQPVYAPAPARQPIGSRTEMQPDGGLWKAGVGLLIAGYALELILTPIANAISNDRMGANEEDAWAWSLLPFVGPMVQLGIGAPHPAIPITTGILQIGGLVLIIVGMTNQHAVQVPVYALGDPTNPATASLSFDVSPTAGGARATATLRF